jgi:thiamine biosynthesis protein ThiI
VREAEAIGTLEVSNLPAEDCCTLFSSPLAETRADARRLAQLEARVEIDQLVERLLATAERVRPGPRERRVATPEPV